MAVGALGQYGTVAVEPLIAALKDRNPIVRAGAANALDQILDQIEDSSRRADANALDELEALRAVAPLIATLNDPNTDVRERAGAALNDIGVPAVESLIASLKSPTADVRMAAAEALAGQSRLSLHEHSYRMNPRPADPRGVAALLAALKKRDIAVVAGAYAFFVWRAEPGSERALSEALNKFGNVRMANDLLNCGNKTLEQAARSWASSRGLQIMTNPGGPQVTWGGRG